MVDVEWHVDLFFREIGVNLHSFHFFWEVENERNNSSFFLRSDGEIEMAQDREREVKFVKISREFSRNEILVGDCHLRNCIMGTYFLQFENLMPVLLENFLGQLWWFPFRPFLNSKDLIAMLETNWLIHEEEVEKMTLYKGLYFFFQFQEGEFDYILPL